MTKKSLFFCGCFITFFALWQWAALTFSNLIFILPPPSAIFKTLWEMRARFWLHTSITLKEMCCGFFLASIFAFPLAWTMIRFQLSRSFLQPLFIIIQCIPMFTLAPIMVVWFGWSTIAIVIPTAFMIFFPLTLNIYQGLRSIPDDFLEFFQANQATRLQIFFKLRLPWAVPHIFAGFRISSAIAGVSAVAGEWAGAQNGLGVLMLESRRNTDLEITFGALFCLTFISALLYALILYCEKIILPPRHWKFPFTHLMKTESKIKKRLAIPFFLFPLIFSLFLGCSGVKKEGPVRLLLDWLPNPNHVPFYVGLRKGYFQEEGIELMIQKMQEGGGGISYLTSKKADLLVSHMPGTLKACEKGAQLKIVGLLIKEPLCGLTYRADPQIKKADDLSGKKFGYCIGVPDINFLDFLLEHGNIHPREKRNVSVDLVSAMGTRSVDFIYGGFWNIEPAQLKSLGIETETFKIQDLGVPLYYEMIILANADSYQSTPDFASRFQKALQKSINFCKTYPEEAFSYFIECNQDRSFKTIEWQKEAWDMTYPLLARDQFIDKELVKEFYSWQLSHGILKYPFDFEELITIR